MAAEYTSTFLRDADELVDRMISGTVSGGPELARALHSVKSGASFLGWEDLEQEAHSLEETLTSENDASDGNSTDWIAAGRLLASMLDAHRPAEGREQHRGPKGSRAVRFTELERRVLLESQERGERFYRLSCEIDPSEPLPYPRVYLLASKFETGMTLVKTEPPVDEADADFSRITLWFTTDTDEGEVYRAANIDQVAVTELIALDYKDVLSKDTVSAGDVLKTISTEDSTLMVDRGRYAEAMEIAEELAWRLEKSPGKPEAALSSEMQKTMETLAFRPLEPMLMELKEGVERLAERRKIKVDFTWSLASGGLDASTMDSLGEILRQLLRNSLRHGIEAPLDRLEAGKSKRGSIKLLMERSGTAYRFVYKDDGYGLDEEAIIEQARIDNPDADDTDLLDILCSRGFSTALKTDADGGRGMGLDMVRHLLNREFDADLEMENRQGLGLSFSWSLPDKHIRRPYLVFVSDGRNWAIPADSVRRRGVMDPTKVNPEGQAYDIGGGLVPMVGPMGLRTPGTVMPYVLEIRHRGRRAALMVEDLVSEEPWGADQLVPADPIGPWCRSLKDAKEGIPILSPAVVFAAESGS